MDIEHDVVLILSRESDEESCVELSCTECGTEFVDASDLKTHYYEVHFATDQDCFCVFCKNTLQSRDHYARHLLKKHLTELFPCKYCCRLFKSEDTLKIHINHHQKLNNRFISCSQCPSFFLELNNLIIHEEFTHSVSINGINIRKHLPHLSSYLNMKVQDFFRAIATSECFRCIKCNLIESNVKTYIKHLKTQRCRSVACNSCGNVFLSKRDLRLHLRDLNCATEGPEKLICDKCNTEYDIKEFLIHEKLCKPQVTCKICKLTFKDVVELSDHYNDAHSSVLNVNKCKYCQIECVGRERLRKHLKLCHKDAHLYKYHCYLCKDHLFNHPRKLFAHFYTRHQEITPYKCKICDESFRVRKAFSLHIKLVHKSIGFVEYDVNFHVFFTDKRTIKKFVYLDFDVRDGNERDEVIELDEVSSDQNLEDELVKDVTVPNTKTSNSEDADLLNYNTDLREEIFVGVENQRVLNPNNSDRVILNAEDVAVTEGYYTVLNNQNIEINPIETVQEVFAEIDNENIFKTINSDRVILNAEDTAVREDYTEQSNNNIEINPIEIVQEIESAGILKSSTIAGTTEDVAGTYLEEIEYLESSEEETEEIEFLQDKTEFPKELPKTKNDEVYSSEDDIPLSKLIKPRRSRKRGKAKAKRFICTKCNKNCYTYQNFVRHKTLHSTESKQCVKCEKLFQTVAELQKHYEKRHAKSKLTEKLQYLLEKRKIKNQYNIKPVQIKKPINPPSVKIVKAVEESSQAIKTYLEKFSNDLELKDVRVTITRVNDTVGMKPKIKTTRVKYNEPVFRGLAQPMPFKKVREESVKVNIVQSGAEAVSANLNFGSCLTSFNEDSNRGYIEGRGNIEYEISISEVSQDLLSQNCDIITEMSSDARSMSANVEDVRVALLTSEPPYYKIVKVGNIAKLSSQKRADDEDQALGMLPKGVKLVKVNPLQHLLKGKVLVSSETKFRKSSLPNHSIAVVAKAYADIAVPKEKGVKGKSKQIKKKDV